MPSMDEMCLAGRTSRRGIRLWEEKGLLGTVERSAGGTRRYTVDQIRRAKIIAITQAVGMSLDDGATFLNNYTDGTYSFLLAELNALRDLLPLPPMEFDL